MNLMDKRSKIGRIWHKSLPAQSIVAGDEVIFTEPVFEGSYKKPIVAGHRAVHCLITRESYGGKRGQHTFSFVVLDSRGYQPLDKGKKTHRKGRNLYQNCRMVRQASDRKDKIQQKDFRRSQAKFRKYQQWYMEGKLDKIPGDILYELTNK